MNKYYAVDISAVVMSDVDFPDVEKKQGTLTCIPYVDKFVDVLYTCEALEHAVDIASAVREMARVVNSGGKIIIIDKPKDLLGTMEIDEWEQWFDVDGLKNILQEYCSTVDVIRNIDYENNHIPGLFAAWIGTVK